MTSFHEQNPVPQITVIGGGTGSYTVLNSLKHISELTALVSMADSGGSSGKLRDQFGMLPPGDVRQCLAALSDSDRLRTLLSYRFPKAEVSGVDEDHELGGHSVGNLMMTALTKITGGDFAEAVEWASDIFRIKGRVIPATLDDRQLVVETTDGQVIEGEKHIDVAQIPSLKGAKISYDKPTEANPAAIEAIEVADMVLIAPGDLYTSIGPALAIGGIAQAIRETKAKVVYLCNLVNKRWHTAGFNVEDYAEEIERIIGDPVLSFVIFNTEKPSEEALKRYAEKGEIPVGYDSVVLSGKHYKTVEGSFLSKDNQPERDANDPIVDRSLIRHDQQAVGRAVMKTYWD